MNTHIIQEITPLSAKDCFYIVERFKKEFTYPLHRHREFELNYIENGSGARRIVGDSIEIIGDYDLTLITGAELEHVWENNSCASQNIREVTIQFSPDLLPASLITKTQFTSIHRMFDDARRGLCFPLSTVMKVYGLINNLLTEGNGFYSVIKFLSILYELSVCDKSRILSSSSFANLPVKTDNKRIDKVVSYIQAHIGEEIRLNTLADMINMTPASFSRFFKLSTGLQLFDYIVSLRIGHATRLLVDTSQTIAEIGYQCGFNNISNFNRAFKKQKDCTPKSFREVYKKKKQLI